MKDTVQIEVRQIRIFSMDALPLLRLLSPAVGKAFKERFGWGTVEAQGEGEVLFRPGYFPGAEDAADAVTIKSLQLNERRMILTVAGDSAAANHVSSAILQFIAETTGWRPVEPVVLTEETGAVTTLDFDWTDLLSPAVVDFVRGPMTDGMSAAAPARAEIRGMSLSFRIAYLDPASRYGEHGITLAEKRLTVEPRINTPFAEKRYFTFSPTDSETHLRLLTELEQAVTSGRPQK